MTKIMFCGAEVIVSHVWDTKAGETFAYFTVDGMPVVVSERDS